MSRASLVAEIVKNLPAVVETQVQSLGGDVPLEKGMQPSLAWRIPWTEEPGKLHSMGHKESDMTRQLADTYTHTNVPVPPQLNLKIPSAMSPTNDCTFKSICLHQMRVVSYILMPLLLFCLPLLSQRKNCFAPLYD